MNQVYPFPRPLAGKTGWPWTHEKFPAPTQMSDGRPWPKISIVTPSYNQAVFIEETIRSVLLQGYPNLEYFVMDGGSTDASVEIIKKYEPWLTGWVSEKDNGQSHAINKGFRLSTGDWMGWLNSDDCYAPQCLFRMIDQAMVENANFVFGPCLHFNFEKSTGKNVWRRIPSRLAAKPDVLILIDCIDQPTSLWRNDLYELCGPLREDLKFVFDWDFFIRISKWTQIAVCSDILAIYRHHRAHKSGMGGKERIEEIFWIYEHYLSSPLSGRIGKFKPLLALLSNIADLRWRGYGARKLLARIVIFLIWKTTLFSLFQLPIECFIALGIIHMQWLPVGRRDQYYVDTFFGKDTDAASDFIALFFSSSVGESK